jgi:hypothetical protein
MILCFDPGVTTGWAILYPSGKLGITGTIALQDIEDLWIAWREFYGHLRRVALQRYSPRRMLIEYPRPTHIAAARSKANLLTIGICALLTRYCYDDLGLHALVVPYARQWKPWYGVRQGKSPQGRMTKKVLQERALHKAIEQKLHHVFSTHHEACAAGMGYWWVQTQHLVDTEK